jgi:hypothetical protein
MIKKEIILIMGFLFLLLIINSALASPMLASPMLASPMLASPMLASPMLASPMLASPMLASPIREGHTVESCTLTDDIKSQIVSINNQIQEIRGRISNYELNADAQAFFDKVSANEKQISGLTGGCEEMQKSCES